MNQTCGLIGGRRGGGGGVGDVNIFTGNPSLEALEGTPAAGLNNAQQGMRNGMTPRKTSQLVVSLETPRFIPNFPTENQQVK